MGDDKGDTLLVQASVKKRSQRRADTHKKALRKAFILSAVMRFNLTGEVKGAHIRTEKVITYKAYGWQNTYRCFETWYCLGKMRDWHPSRYRELRPSKTKPYGVKRGDIGCCPGHDKYPKAPYLITRRSSWRQRDRSRKKRARQEAKKEIQKELQDFFLKEQG